MSKISEADRKVFTDLYNYYAKWHDAPYSTETFCSMADEMAVLVIQNGESQLAKDLLIAVYDHLGRSLRNEAQQSG